MKLTQTDVWRGVAILAVFFVLAWLPAVPGADGWLSIVVPITMYTVLATSWAIFSGPTHYVSLATAAFFG
ncbi:MAG: hypothetical protein R3311_18960, partial [Oceanisphaera sp.]|nr:hypothetical protein [Oceanisphaera sp.]